MSIGFIGSRSSQRTIDVFSGGANRNVEVSLQNVLNKYDKIKTDLDRLVDQAQFGSYDITSRQHYNAYKKESVNGWAENWYAEYRAVLALRSDALQKKLQASYNRVLERSAFAEIKPDQTSVFAPYANRTYKDNATTTDNLNNKMPISSVLMADGVIESTPNTITPYDSLWGTGTTLDNNISSYLNSNSGPGTFPAGRDALTNYTTAQRATFTIYHTNSGIPRPAASSPTLAAGYIPAWNGGPVYAFPHLPNPPIPANPTAVEIAKRQAQKDQVIAGIKQSIADNFGTPPSDPSELSYFNKAKDKAIEAALRDADLTWKNGVSSGDSDSDGFSDDNRDRLTPSDFYSSAYDTVEQYKYISPIVVPDPTDPTPPAGSVPSGYNGSYTSSSDSGSSEYMGLGMGNFKKYVPMFGAGDILAILKQNASIDLTQIQDTIGGMTLEDITARANDMIQSFAGVQYDNVYRGNQYEVETKATSTIVTPILGSGSNKIYDNLNSDDENYPGGSIISAGYTGHTQIPGFATTIQLIPPNPSFPPGLTMSIGAQVTVGPDLYYGHESAISNLSSSGGIFGLPTLGLGAVSASLAFGIGVATPASPVFGAVVTKSLSYDFFADAFKQILTKLKKLLVESMTVNSYATSSGTALDSYSSRAEYHFTRPAFTEGLKALDFKMNIPVIGAIPFPIGSLLNTYIFNGTGIGLIDGALGLGTLSGTEADDTYVNNTVVADRLFKYKHGVQGAESRETETGAFFATNAFLSQFELADMESEYWIGTQQNEELFDSDLARSMLTAGPELIKTIFSTVLAAMPLYSGESSTVDGIVKGVLSGIKDKELLNMMYDLMYRDQDGQQGKTNTGSAISQANSPFLGARSYDNPSSISTEAYDYIETDHKPFEGDSDFNYKQSGLLSLIPLVGDLIESVFAANTPDFVLDGLANTMRFTNYETYTLIANGQVYYDKPTNYDSNPSLYIYKNYDDDIRMTDVIAAAGNQDAMEGLGPRGMAGRGGRTNQNQDFTVAKGGALHDYGYNEETPDGSLWSDTKLGDINEVYSATRKVRFKDLSMGFEEFSELNISDDAARLRPDLVGLPGSPDEFWDGTKDANGNYTNGVLRDTATASSNLGAKRLTAADVNRYVGTDTRINERRYDGANPVQHESFTSNMYSGKTEGKKQYDRRNQYSMAFQTKADKGNEFSLFGSQALNPTIGGFIKMATIDKNADDKVLIEHGKGGMASVRSLGANAVTNTISATADGVNASDVQKFGGTVDGQLNELNQLLYEHLHLRADGKNLSLIKEYRDVFETGLMKSIFISGQSYHPSGGGITSSIEIRYDSSIGRSEVQGAKGLEMANNAKKTREYYDATRNDFDPYNTPFLTKSNGQAAIYLNTYFAYKKRASNNKT